MSRRMDYRDISGRCPYSQREQSLFLVVDFPLQRSSLSLFEVSLYAELLTGLIYELDLLAIGFRRRHFERPAQTVGEREGRLDVPRVTPINVVVRDSALVKRVREGRIQGKISTGAGVSDLCVGNDTQDSSGVAAPNG